jgi:hypothetical protein
MLWLLRSFGLVPAFLPQRFTVIDLFRRLANGLVPGSAASASTTDFESSAIVDGAELTEMDCRWSPSMGLQPAPFEETQPHALVRPPAAS